MRSGECKTGLSLYIDPGVKNKFLFHPLLHKLEEFNDVLTFTALISK